MRELQAQIIHEMGVKPNMTEEQAREEVERRIQFICDYLEATGSRGLVLGSTLAGRLCQLAVDRLNERGRTTEFVAVRLPYRVQHDEEDAQEDGDARRLRTHGEQSRDGRGRALVNIGRP